MADQGLYIGGFITSFANSYLRAREHAREVALQEDRSKREAAQWLLSNLGQFSEEQGGPGEQAAKALLSGLISAPQQEAPSKLSRAMPGGKGRQAKAAATGPQQGLDQFKALMEKYPLFEKPAVRPKLAELPMPGQAEAAPGQQFTAGTEGAPGRQGILKPVPQPVSQMDLERMRLQGQYATQEMVQKDITERSRERMESEASLARERAQERQDALKQHLQLSYDQLQSRIDEAKQRSIDRNLAERDRREYQIEMLRLRKEQSEVNPSAWAQLVKTGQAKLSDIPDKATRNRVAESAVKEGWGIPVKLPAADAKSVRDADTFVTQIDKILAMLEPVKDDNTPAYAPGGKGPGITDRAAYSAGRRTQWSDYISFSERGAVQTVTGFLRGTRNQKWIDRILVHTPHTWTDSPANAYGKLQAMKESLQDMKREITGGKDVQLVGDRLVETTTETQTPQVLNYDRNGNLIQ